MGEKLTDTPGDSKPAEQPVVDTGEPKHLSSDDIVKPAAEQGSEGQGDVGRPTDYSVELDDMICDRISDGRSLRSVCQDEDMPSKATVYRWLRSNETFRDNYARACEDRAEAMAEDILDISDDGRNDTYEVEGPDGETYEKVNTEVLQRSRLRVDTRKFLMSKMKPKKYGDKLDLTTGGDKIDRTMSDVELNAILERAARGVTDQTSTSSQT